MKVTLVVNTQKEAAAAYTEIVQQALAQGHAKVRVLCTGAYTRDDFSDADAIITIGGDGTMLRLAGVLRGQDTPILGINAGHLGYLTQVSRKEQIPAAIEQLLSHAYTRDVRAMLHGSIRRGTEVLHRDTALNEVLISRCEGIRMLRFTVFCDGRNSAAIRRTAFFLRHRPAPRPTTCLRAGRLQLRKPG